MILLLFLIFNLLKKNNLLAIMMSIEMLSILILLFIQFIFHNLIFYYLYISFFICEAVIGLTLCIKFSMTFNNISFAHLNFSK